ncbi:MULTISPECIES: MbtH family protein [Streptomyces]|uniref:MbtH family protein n=1 Tax=Streptomyces TaxID=1883 RepID=UPI002F90C22D|nr:MbtH family protein [Streptomyces albidoflavus]
MTNPFEDPEGRFLVVVNEEGRHALWPSFAGLPPGWSTVLPETDRRSCVEYVERNWSGV